MVCGNSFLSQCLPLGWRGWRSLLKGSFRDFFCGSYSPGGLVEACGRLLTIASLEGRDVVFSSSAMNPLPISLRKYQTGSMENAPMTPLSTLSKIRIRRAPLNWIYSIGRRYLHGQGSKIDQYRRKESRE